MKTPNNEFVDLATVAAMIIGGGAAVLLLGFLVLGVAVWINDVYGAEAAFGFGFAVSSFVAVSGAAIRAGWVKYMEGDRRY